jgi:hypothetical protein
MFFLFFLQNTFYSFAASNYISLGGGGGSVPDKRSRIHEVVIVRRYSPGYWEFGVGREWERVEKGEVSLRVTRERGGRILSQLGGFQVSKRDQERGAKGNQQGFSRKKQGDSATCI